MKLGPVDFPYHWNADELVSRRELLRFTVYASGALFAATGGLALQGLREPARAGVRTFVARLADVPEGSALYFRYPTPDDQAMLLHLPGGRLVAYSQRCTHLSCAVYYQPGRQRLYCPCHEGVFDPGSGDPVAGPPTRRLATILLQTEGDRIYAVARQP